jgi:hypothetical protein
MGKRIGKVRNIGDEKLYFTIGLNLNYSNIWLNFILR